CHTPFVSDSADLYPCNPMRSRYGIRLALSGGVRRARNWRRSLAGICPDFVVELRSPSDRVADIEAKMEEYIANGSRLGWLLDPIENRAIIYRPGEPPERLDKL